MCICDNVCVRVRVSACTTSESYTRISLGQGCVGVRPAEAKLLTEVQQEGGLTVSLTPGIARAHTHRKPQQTHNTRSDLPQITAAVCKCPHVHTAGVSSVCGRGDSGWGDCQVDGGYSSPPTHLAGLGKQPEGP